MKTKIINGKEMLVEELIQSNGTSKELYYIKKVKYIGEDDPISFFNGKTYYVLYR